MKVFELMPRSQTGRVRTLLQALMTLIGQAALHSKGARAQVTLMAFTLFDETCKGNKEGDLRQDPAQNSVSAQIWKEIPCLL